MNYITESRLCPSCGTVNHLNLRACPNDWDRIYVDCIYCFYGAPIDHWKRMTDAADESAERHVNPAGMPG